MLFNTAYIISYLPNDSLKARRLEIHNKQVDYWLAKGLNVLVYAQGYQQDDFRKDVQYIVNTRGETDRPGPARNVLLRAFYDSDEDFCLLMDNDIVLYEGEKYCDSDNLVQILKDIPLESLEGVDVFEPLNPTQTPFSAFYAEKKDVLANNLIFKRRPNISGCCLFIRNFKKFGEEPFFYNDWFDEKTGKVIMGEDVAFGLNLTKKGKGVYSLMNAVRKDMGWTSSSWCKSPEIRKQSFETLKAILPTLGVGTKNGNLDWAGFADRYKIPRQVLAPKKKSASILDMM